MCVELQICFHKCNLYRYGVPKHWKISFESVQSAGGYKGWKVRHANGLSVLAKGYKYVVPPNAWQDGEEIVFELVGRCKLYSVDRKLESACFQPLNCMPDFSGLYLG